MIIFTSHLTSSNKLEADLDTDDEEECDSSFVIIYQLMFGKRVNIYLNQNDTYMLYEVRSEPIGA